MNKAQVTSVKQLLDQDPRWFEEAGRMDLAQMSSRNYPYAKLFSPIQVNHLTLKNRIMMGPMGNISCACYLPEVGNIPRKGAMLAWPASSAVVFANSVPGARTNRNSSGIDIISAILGKAPLFGSLTEDGRQATWKIEVATSRCPNAQLLGSAIDLTVMDAVPYIVGLDRFFGTEVTPEAKEIGGGLLAEGYQTYVTDDAELERVYASYPILWRDLEATPKRIFIGCPHLNRFQLEAWIERISGALKEHGLTRAKMPVALTTAPDLADVFRDDPRIRAKLTAMNVSIATICPLMYMTNTLCARAPVATNSNKLRT